ncbi:RND family efflux transporter, MFP subunit [Lentibacillus persicus]|uniref:RND family efflux transporter, MFP subunit n=1 Tax=Lentibacillus persicus TaxID=640948 RepID=A0A1I1XT22_9BACI|nr:efflux RND transporter periplasmic adaptor subunit [Lentibacillus persicus]SFE10495.1 RND family efflux transporter, MFP subunit [Lentibacillus persicus]
MRKILIMTAAILLISLLAACNQEEENDDEQEEQETAVETGEVTQDNLVIEKSVYGRTQPDSSTPVMAPGPGEVTELEVENGDTVEEDDHLATVRTAAGSQRVTASASGEIASLNVEENAMASESDPMMVIADFSSMTINLTVSSDALNLFTTGDTHTAVIDDEEYEAEITSVGSMPDDTGLYPVEATVENTDDAIVSGMVAVVNVPENRVEDTLLVPTEAVVTESGESIVYVVEDNQAVQKSINVQASQSAQTAVTGDIEEGDQVVVNGLLTLSDGMNVTVAEEEDNS